MLVKKGSYWILADCFSHKLSSQFTHFLSKNSVVKNLKLLKKYLNNLTVTIIYSENSLRNRALSNFSLEIRSILEEKPPN